MSKRKTNPKAVKSQTVPQGWDKIEGDLIEVDAGDLMVCLTAPTETAASLPCLNHGRESKASWSDPWKTVPVDLVHGWNKHLGAVVVIPVEDLDRLGVTGPDSTFYRSAIEAAADYGNRLEANVARMVPDSGYRYCVGSSVATVEGKQVAQDKELILERAAFVQYLKKQTIAPRFVAISAQRRTMAAFPSNYLREKEGLKPIRFPVIVKRFATLQELWLSQVEDNRDNSKADYKADGLISNYMLRLDANPMQSQTALALAAGVAVGIGQKAYALATWARQTGFPLVERLRKEPVTQDGKIVYQPGGFINFSSLDKECCRGIAGQVAKELPKALEAIFVDEEGAFRATKEVVPGPDGLTIHLPPTWEPGQLATCEQFERYVELAMSGSTRSSTLDKARVKNLINTLSLDQRRKAVTVGQALRAVLNGNEQFFQSPPDLDTQATKEAADGMKRV